MLMTSLLLKITYLLQHIIIVIHKCLVSSSRSEEKLYVNDFTTFENYLSVMAALIRYFLVLSFRSETHKGELDPSVQAFQYNYLLKDLHGCSNYRLALGLKTKGLGKQDWLYSFTSIVTPVNDGTLNHLQIN